MNPDEIAAYLETLKPYVSRALKPLSQDSLMLNKRYDFAHDEQFRNGMYWTGRRPHGGGFAEIDRLFVADDQIGPALTTYVDAVLGRDPEFVVSNAVQSLTDELNVKLDKFEKRSNIHRKIRQAEHDSLWGGHVGLRFFIPRRYGDAVIEGSVPDLASALRRFELQIIDARFCGTLYDDDDVAEGTYYLYRGADNVERIEVHTPSLIVKGRLLGTDASWESATPNVLNDPGGDGSMLMMMVFERERGSVLTRSSLKKQQRLNVSWTGVGRNEDTAAFRNVMTFNADDPVDEKGEETEWVFGPDIVNNLRGLPHSNDAGEATGSLHMPGVYVIEPVDPNTFLDTIAARKASLRSDFQQSWTLGSLLTVSGVSREEARKPFERWVVREAAWVSEIYDWLYAVVLELSAFLTGRGELKDTVISPKLYIDVSSGNLLLWKELLGGYKDNVVSLEALVDANPAISDSNAELERLKSGINTNPFMAVLLSTFASVPAHALLEALRNAGFESITAQMITDAQDMANADLQAPTLPNNIQVMTPLDNSSSGVGTNNIQGSGG